MTEDEAKTKVCCGPYLLAMATLLAADLEQAVEAPPGSAIDKGGLCIGSACMAWRGKPGRAFESMADAEFRNTGKRLQPGPSEMEGFCGLAGAPP